MNKQLLLVSYHNLCIKLIIICKCYDSTQYSLLTTNNMVLHVEYNYYMHQYEEYPGSLYMYLRVDVLMILALCVCYYSSDDTIF